jgi:CBS domain-containing protein
MRRPTLTCGIESNNGRWWPTQSGSDAGASHHWTVRRGELYGWTRARETLCGAADATCRGVETQGQEIAMPQVREFMTSEVVTIEPSASIVDAATKMIQQEKGPLPVVEGTKAVAMVTDRDIIARVVAAGRDPGSMRVEEIATKDLVTISPDADVDAARQLMAQHQLDRILVVEGDTLVGIISEADIRTDEGPLA